MKKIKYILSVILLVILTSCSDFANVEQKTTYIDNSDCFFISTYIWYHHSDNYIVGEIVYSNYHCVSIDSLKIVKERELIKANKLKDVLNKALNE